MLEVFPSISTVQPTRNASLHEEEPKERGRYPNEFILSNNKDIFAIGKEYIKVIFV